MGGSTVGPEEAIEELEATEVSLDSSFQDVISFCSAMYATSFAVDGFDESASLAVVQAGTGYLT